MQFKKLFLILFVGLLNYSVAAQETPSFPHAGNFIVQLSEGQQLRFTKVSIASNTFETILNDQILRYFRIVSQNGSVYEIEQYFLVNDEPKRDRERFTMTIVNSTENTYTLSLLFLSGHTEVVNLSRI